MPNVVNQDKLVGTVATTDRNNNRHFQDGHSEHKNTCKLQSLARDNVIIALETHNVDVIHC